MVFSAVLDTSVLFPFYLRDTLLRVAAQDLFRPLWSGDILEELQRELLETYPLNPPDVDHLLRQMTEHFPDSLVETYEGLITQVDTPDPQDRHVLAAAIKAGAEAIVTANVRDFPPDCQETYGVSVQSPDEFLVERFHEDPRRVLAALEEQTRPYKRPSMTVEELIDRLDLPHFARAVRARGSQR